MKPLHELILPLDFNSRADLVQPVKLYQLYINISVVVIQPLTTTTEILAMNVVMKSQSRTCETGSEAPAAQAHSSDATSHSILSYSSFSGPW